MSDKIDLSGIDISNIEYLQVNVDNFKVFKSRSQTAVRYAVYPRNKLVRLTDHALRRRLLDGWVTPVEKADYDAYLDGKYVPQAVEPWKPSDEEFFARRRTKRREQLLPQDLDENSPSIDDDAPQPPEYDDEGNPLRDGMDMNQFWEAHREGPPEGKKGAGKGVCPDCGKKWSGKAKLFKCCFTVPPKATA